MPSVPLGGVAASLGSALGKGVAQPFEEGLNLLAQKKLMQIQQQQQQQASQAERQRYAQGVAPLLGEETAQFLSNLGPEERKAALQNIGSLMQLQGIGGQPSMQQKSPMQSSVQQLQQLQNPMNVANFMGLEESKGQLNPVQEQQQMQQLQKGIQAPLQQDVRGKLIEDIFTSPQEKREREKLELEKKKLTSREDLAAWKNTQAYREKLLDTEQAARDALDSIKEAQELEKSGDFPSQQFASFLKGAEWEDIPGFLSGSAEAYNKILANFQRGAKEIYGGRITNFEMEQFLKTIPTLQHTPEGRSRIWSMMKKYYRGGKEIAKIERQIIKENGGKPPQDLHEQVNARFKPIAKDISRKFKKDLQEAEKLRADLSSRLGSILSYGAGKVASAIPGTLKGAAKGALTGAAAGSIIPGAGTGAGALIGGGLGALGGASGGTGGILDVLKLLF